MYLESNPEAYARIIRKKKVEEMENGGMYSYLKVWYILRYLHIVVALIIVQLLLYNPSSKSIYRLHKEFA